MPNYARFNGGPLDEQLHETPDDAGWPLPGELTLALLSLGTTFAIGRYIKLGESQLTDEQADHPGIGRGAVYEWHEGDHETAAPEYKEPWNESTGEGVDMSRASRDLDTLEDPKASHAGARERLEAALSRPAPADWDPRTDYPERFTEGPI